MTHEDETETVPQSNKIERHIQTFLLAAVVALLYWNFDTVQKTQIEVASLRSDVNTLKTSLNMATQNRYTNDEAAAEHSRMYNRMDRLENRIERLEGVD